ncbi:hypothetical protein Tsubulata_023498 [Turnera subulata]|uniref:Peroxin-3 n=1 Tax=Turnera subulata TaxID=218843 RepID=A0A9Q0GEN4_9ROSI|nr:hypothetical protein Tsubulata_023498 [Turnera subulata]
MELLVLEVVCLCSGRDFWRRHRRKILVTGGVLGSGYLLYRLYDGHQRRLADLERELARQRENDELIKAQMHAHFENVQRIADTTTLPHAMHYLSTRIEEELDLSHLTERLMKGKGQPNTMSSSEKLELWERLKILSMKLHLAESVWEARSICNKFVILFVPLVNNDKDAGLQRTNKEQSFDQEFEKYNEALRVSCLEGYPVRVVSKYSRVRKWTHGLTGGKDLIAVIRASGAFSRLRSPLSSSDSGIVGEQLIEKILTVRRRYGIAPASTFSQRRKLSIPLLEG